MVQSAAKTLTLEGFVKLPETKPASEYIDGRILQKPMPQGKHSTIQGELISTINSLVKSQRIALAFPELRCTFGGRSIVPDVAVFAWERIPLDENGDVANVFEAAPDWTIEILSPDQSQTKVTIEIGRPLRVFPLAVPCVQVSKYTAPSMIMTTFVYFDDLELLFQSLDQSFDRTPYGLRLHNRLGERFYVVLLHCTFI